MAEVAEQPPEPLGAAHVPVGDHEGAVADARPRRGLGEIIRIRQRMPAARAGWSRQVLVDVEKAGTRDVTAEIELTAAAGAAELPATIDELVTQGAGTLRGFGLHRRVTVHVAYQVRVTPKAP
jgi:hypothetical protein